MVKKELLISVMLASMLILSACDVYKTLYIKQSDLEKIDDEKIIIANLEDKGLLSNDILTNNSANLVEVGTFQSDSPVLIIQETEKVSLQPKAEDPDDDILIFTYTSPLDEKGEWQTSYGDAGEYTVTITASDGSLTASKEALIIVTRKDEAPTLDNFRPSEKAIEIVETDSIVFEVETSDLNDDVLRHFWKLDGVETKNGKTFEFKSTYEDEGSHTVKVIVSDGLYETEKIWAITVRNVNRKPQIADINQIRIKETETAIIELDAWDDDGDLLEYSIDDSRFEQNGNIFSWITTYDDSGDHNIVVSVTDGVDTEEQTVKVSVDNVNRAPVIIDIVQKK
jgi:PKD repeat protein